MIRDGLCLPPPYQVDGVVVAGGHVQGVLHLLETAGAHGGLSGVQRGC